MFYRDKFQKSVLRSDILALQELKDQLCVEKVCQANT